MTRRPLAVALFAAIVAAFVVVPGVPASAAPPAVTRLGSTSAAGVAILASRVAFPAAASAGTVVITSDTDPLLCSIAGAAAASLDGSLLLTAPTAMTVATRAELTRLAPERIIIVGATKDVSAALEANLRAAYPDTERITGVDVYATSLLVAARSETSATDAVVVPFVSTATALSAAALAGAQDSPLVLVRSTDAVVRDDVAAILSSKGATSVTLVGGVAAPATGLRQSLEARQLDVDAVTGADFSALALAVAARFPTPTRAFVAPTTGSGLGAGAVAYAGSTGSPIIFSGFLCASPAFTAAVSGIPTLTLLGVPTQIRGLVGTLTPCLSTTTASSPWVFVNKKNRLNPASYVPASLRVPSIRRTGSHQLQSTAATQLEKLAAGVKAAGKGEIGIVSGYRSYATQKALYARYVRTKGQAWADSQSARAGHSEHQLGLAADVSACTASGCSSIYTFDKTAQGKWVAANAHKYGFIIRYAYGQTKTTGYSFEPWHLRYVGIPLATDYKAGGFTTLEAYYGKPAAPKY